jgi:ribosomal protein L11 methyltransferase
VAGRRYDTIVSNILRGPLRRLAPAIARHMAPGDDVILAGLLNWEEPAVRSRYRAAGLVFTGRIAIEGWHILTFRR